MVRFSNIPHNLHSFIPFGWALFHNYEKSSLLVLPLELRATARNIVGKMKTALIGASIIIGIFAGLILFQGLHNFSSFLDFYLRCLDDRAKGVLPSYSSCPYQYTDSQWLFMPFALFGIAVWLCYWGIKGRLSSALENLRMIVPILVAATASVLTLSLRGIIMFSDFLECYRRCPTGICAGSGNGPDLNCTLPVLEFVLPLTIIGISCAIMLAYARKSGMKA